MERSRRPLTSCGKTVTGDMVFDDFWHSSVSKKRTQDRPQRGWEFECRFRVVWGPGCFKKSSDMLFELEVRVWKLILLFPYMPLRRPIGETSWEGGVVDPI